MCAAFAASLMEMNTLIHGTFSAQFYCQRKIPISTLNLKKLQISKVKMEPFTSQPSSMLFGISRKRRATRFVYRAYADSETQERVLQKAKLDLLRAAQNTQRGLQASDDQRASIEEAMVSVEQYDAGKPINLDQLDGTWLLQYTSASDVLVLFEAARSPFLQVGQIYQKFECKGCTDGGVVRNIVRCSIPSILQENEGAMLLVTAKFSLLSQRNIFLEFEEVTVGNLMISEQLQTLIAPAILPRTSLNLEILQFLRGFEAKFSLQRYTKEQADGRRASPGGLYYLSYLDGDMLLGRAIGGGGIFIFSRTQPFQI
ncbi:probable plastid-lipid-associated protein 10, chloroplastic isoform X2 [Cryptomeria japonica]|uniref:probable plastid-lipid-associated protein 10, chloroplastic isoform X2 n=1 Tax=Cryptomeria japonica TaxID=3369 RepID=UPI0027D9F1F3|nr:probable plastid-lipid-associated protein 10, chloroplastic isoform X2 [Cryptomeria japonica]